ncbi:MAG: CaiB/BaiF CoA-transferase family protein [Proteobacteria bacterium]|nr:CaiB/BaiF CoA-transferase family protein [Pseudomonadota bacterium]
MAVQDSSKDLDGVLVVTVEQAVAAPYTSCRLADAGARVIKVERPEGDFARNYDSNALGNSAYFVWLNRGKESVSLDLKNKDDFLLFKNIISKADILIQNLAPGAFDRLGLDLKELRKEYPRLITCSISGFGDDGPYKNQKAYDMLIQAETGVIDITGHPDKDGFDGRAKVGPSVCDISAGMTAYQAILQALIKRGITGEGRHISVSMFNSLADWMNPFYLGYVYNQKTPKRNGMTHPIIVPYGAYSCKDNLTILIAIQNDREWLNLCKIVLEDEPMAYDSKFKTNSDRVLNRELTEKIIQDKFMKFEREELISKLEKASVAYGRISDMEQLKNHPQNNFLEIDTKNGVVKVLGPGAIHDNYIPTVNKMPELNEHGEMIRAEFGS